MLHPVPDSAFRDRLMEVVDMQKSMIDALCQLPQNQVIDVVWLKGIWPSVSGEWVDRFWNLPKVSKDDKSGRRSVWIRTIALASVNDKALIKALLVEQLSFSQLYSDPPTIILTKQNWTPPVFSAVKDLLLSFYAPLFYEGEGYPNADGSSFHKDIFIDPNPIICPYTDNYIHDTKLDHFLPKADFPMLSCHPDNLIPCSTDANSGGQKGNEVPLDLGEPDQALKWFHPRWRNAVDKYTLTFMAPPRATQQRVQFIANVPADQPRLDNMNKIFGLDDFWGRTAGLEVHPIAAEVADGLKEDNVVATEDIVKDRLAKLAKKAFKKIGTDGLGIVKYFWLEHIGNDPNLLDEVLRTCNA